MPAAPAKKNHFKKLQNFKADYTQAEFTQYESERTGMRVNVCDRKGPKVQGYFALATEIHDDSGAPHTLEHLCFMGSRSFPYKGVLDRLATRSYSFTNAWTATDHTAYTLDTAGWEGFAQIRKSSTFMWQGLPANIISSAGVPRSCHSADSH
jgi:Zn-dependent M16 (insulinase) family peptidase